MFRKQQPEVNVGIVEAAERLGRVLSRDSVHARSMIIRGADPISYHPRPLI